MIVSAPGYGLVLPLAHFGHFGALVVLLLLLGSLATLAGVVYHGRRVQRRDGRPSLRAHGKG